LNIKVSTDEQLNIAGNLSYQFLLLTTH